jgi:predicted alpha/beta hydrolase family esterase
LVNRISQYLESGTAAGHVTVEDRDMASTPHEPDRAAWIALLEQQVTSRPKLCLGIAFSVGLGLAWLIKRK